MAFTKEYRAEVEEKLAAAAPIRSRAMFGGVGIYSEELLFALIDDDKLYFKADDLSKAEYEARGMDAFYPYEGAKPMPYWELPPGILDDVTELKVWIDRSLAVAAAKKKKKK